MNTIYVYVLMYYTHIHTCACGYMDTSSFFVSTALSRFFSACEQTTAIVSAGTHARKICHMCQAGPSLFAGRSRKRALNESEVIRAAACRQRHAAHMRLRSREYVCVCVCWKGGGGCWYVLERAHRKASHLAAGTRLRKETWCCWGCQMLRLPCIFDAVATLPTFIRGAFHVARSFRLNKQLSSFLERLWNGCFQL